MNLYLQEVVKWIGGDVLTDRKEHNLTWKLLELNLTVGSLSDFLVSGDLI